jgi:hypothetical protein
MSAANTAAAGKKTALFLIHAPQQGKKPSINEGGQMSMRVAAAEPEPFSVLRGHLSLDPGLEAAQQGVVAGHRLA